VNQICMPADIDFAAELSRGFAASYIRRKAREIARQTAPWLRDVDDLAQELTLQVLQSLQQFNSEQGCFNAFVKLVVDRDAANMKRDLNRELENRGDEMSLSTLVLGPEGTREPLGNTIGDEERDALRGRQTTPWQETVECEQDVAMLVSRLPQRLRYVAESLMQFATRGEIARALRVSRTTVHDLTRQIREQFDQA
jgi:DNA-directed RNA polymerase specialized sigma24 family protein